MSLDVAKLELKALKDSPAFLKNYKSGIQALAGSGVIGFLRTFARPFLYDGGADLNRAAASAAYSAGYHAALDEILYFNELYMTESKEHKKTPLDFGGRKIALARGDLLEGDFKK